MWIGEMRSQSSAGNLPTYSQLNPTYGTYTIYLAVSTLWVEAILHMKRHQLHDKTQSLLEIVNMFYMFYTFCSKQNKEVKVTGLP